MRNVSTSPHFHCGTSTKRIMIDVSIALLPACIWGVFLFGFRALLVLAISLISSVGFEVLFKRIGNDNSSFDFSSVVTGLLVGMNMPSSIPLFIPVIASFFAIVVVKWTFGGLGANWANPAIAGRAFVFFSFTSAMSTFNMPKLLSPDAISSASPLSLIKTVKAAGNAGMSSLEILKTNSYPVSDFAMNLSSKLNINPYNIDALFGIKPGCIGEVSAILLIVGFVYLLARKVITWHITGSFIGFYAIMTAIFCGFEEVIPSILRGGLLLGAIFMATDYVTSPITHKGHIIFGFGCALFTFLFRNYGSLPEATSVAILIMNMVTPTIDKFCKPVLFGEVQK